MSILFTRDFSKPYLALSAVLAAGILYACILSSMLALATWAERDLGAFPFKQEDWLRYLVPSRFAIGNRQSILLTGPSTVRENFRYERFAEAFPDYSIWQGGISLGTIEDVTASLEYVEKVYGADALPKIMVLGISPRFIADIPDKRPFRLGIDRYSPHFSTGHEPLGITFIPKGPLESLVARTRFLAAKQPERIRTGLLAVITHWFLREPRQNPAGKIESELANTGRTPLDTIIQNPVVSKLIRFAGFARVLEHSVSGIVEWRISPYKYAESRSRNVEKMLRWMTSNAPDAWWKLVYTWDPVKNATVTKGKLKKLVEFLDVHNIQFLVVNMPERDISRDLFDEANYQAYLDLVGSSFGGAPFLNFREFLRSDEFIDAEHSLVPGSFRLTAEIIKKMKASKLVLGADR